MNLKIKGIIVVTMLFASLNAVAKSSLSVKNQYINNLRDTLPVADSAGDPFNKVEIEAYYPGGEKAWLQFIIQNIHSDVPVKKKAPAGVYTAVIQFIVDKDGNVTDITPLTNHGFGMEQEVVRVLKMSPRWKPAVQDGRKVRAYRKQPVTFQVEEEKKKKRNKDD